ncbi:MAG: GDP-L-fucose synthase [Alphaproteobacteria bacterium]|nr:GDP-L-fucose synthase [Alphaproteobacteria bacterium]
MTARYALAGKTVYVAGHTGMVGGALLRRLAREACTVVTAPRSEVDLRDQAAVFDWMRRARPDCVIVAAATVGGILANSTRPADFLYDNLAMGANLIEAARRAGVEKLLYLGSTCIYPRLAPQPIVEEALLTGPLEPTNEWYAIAKIASLKLCAAYRRQYGCDFIAAQPTNLYGPGDNFNLESAHVIPALMAKIHAAKVTNAPAVELWGTGTPLREFLHVDDLADALVFLVQHYSDELHINIGTGEEISIGDLASTLAEVIGFGGVFRYDRGKPDGTPRKLADVARLQAMGWRASSSLRDGLARTYAWYLQNVGVAVRA